MKQYIYNEIPGNIHRRLNYINSNTKYLEFIYNCQPRRLLLDALLHIPITIS